jgi:hypothetical protein
MDLSVDDRERLSSAHAVALRAARRVLAIAEKLSGISSGAYLKPGPEVLRFLAIPAGAKLFRISERDLLGLLFEQYAGSLVKLQAQRRGLPWRVLLGAKAFARLQQERGEKLLQLRRAHASAQRLAALTPTSGGEPSPDLESFFRSYRERVARARRLREKTSAENCRPYRGNPWREAQ